MSIIIKTTQVGTRLNAFPAAKFIAEYLMPESLQHDPDFFLRGELPPHSYSNLLYEAPGLLSSGFGIISLIRVFLRHICSYSLFSQFINF
jgi:hypothetical protein